MKGYAYPPDIVGNRKSDMKILTRAVLHSCISVTAMLGAMQFVYAQGTLTVSPACPVATGTVTLTAVQGPLSAPYQSVLSTDVQGDTIKVVVVASNFFIPLAPPVSIDVPLGRLPEGDYHVDFAYRIPTGSGQLGPEQPDGHWDFRVTVVASESCAPWAIEVADGAALSTVAATSFAPIRVLVRDSAGAPVNGAVIHVERTVLYWDPARAGETAADAGLGGRTFRTNAQGFAEISAVANSSLGTYQYTMAVTQANVRSRSYVVLSNRVVGFDPLARPVVEYANSSNGHYFMTMSALEIARLDRGDFAFWTRTGAAFLGREAGSTSSGSPVCRFYGRPEAGLDSHFYSASVGECAAVVQKFAHAWLLESLNVFEIALPDLIMGACPTATGPVYRVFNNQADVNHRYLTSKTGVQAMVAKGWLPEGYGPESVVMCAPM